MDQPVKDEAAEALQWVLAAKLTVQEWSWADEAIAAAESALAADDEKALRAAAFALDQLLLRVKEKLGQEPATAPVTDNRRDRMVALMHRMASQPIGQPAGPPGGRPAERER